MLNDQQPLYVVTEVEEMDCVTGSIYFNDPGVDRHHCMFISSYYTANIHSVTFPNVVSTPSWQSFEDPRNGVDPRGRVVSYLNTLRSFYFSQNRFL